MKFLRILGVTAAAVLMTTAVARQAATAPAAPEPPASSTSAPVATPATVPATAPATAPAGTAAATPAATPESPPIVGEVVVVAPATAGDAKAGQAKAGACAACHGLDGNSTDAQYPKLAGQQERFIWRQLQLFKSGERENPIMSGMAAPLSEQDMRDIGAFFASGPNAGKKFYKVGESIFRAGKPKADVPACLACHGPTGRGNPGPSYPSLGGQHSAYTVARLQFFRGGGVWGKDSHANVIMSQVARDLSDEEIQGLATYIEGLHSATEATTAKAE